MSAEWSSCFVILILVTSAGLPLGCSQTTQVPPGKDADVRGFHLFSTPVEHPSAREEGYLRRNTSPYGLEAGVLRSQLVVTELGRIWVFPNGRLVCIANARAAACAPRRAAHESGVFLGVFSPPDTGNPSIHNFLVVGLVSDDVRAVTVVVGDHAPVTLDVANNIFNIRARKPIQVLQLVRHR